MHQSYLLFLIVQPFSSLSSANFCLHEWIMLDFLVNLVGLGAISDTNDRFGPLVFLLLSCKILVVFCLIWLCVELWLGFVELQFFNVCSLLF